MGTITSSGCVGRNPPIFGSSTHTDTVVCSHIEEKGWHLRERQGTVFAEVATVFLSVPFLHQLRPNHNYNLIMFPSFLPQDKLIDAVVFIIFPPFPFQDFFISAVAASFNFCPLKFESPSLSSCFTSISPFLSDQFLLGSRHYASALPLYF